MADTSIRKIDARVAYSVAKMLDLIPEWAYLTWWSPPLPADWDDTQPLPVPPPFPAWLNIPGNTALHTALAIGASLYKRGLKGVKVLGGYLFKGRGDGTGTTVSRVRIKLDIPGIISNYLVLSDGKALIATIPAAGYVDDGVIEPRLWHFNNGDLAPLDTGPYHYWTSMTRLGNDKALLIDSNDDGISSHWYFADGKLTPCQKEGFRFDVYHHVECIGDGEAIISARYGTTNVHADVAWYFDHGVLTKIGDGLDTSVTVIGDRRALIWFATDAMRGGFRMIYLSNGKFRTILESPDASDFSAGQAQALGNNKALIWEYLPGNAGNRLWYFDDGVLTRTPLEGYTAFIPWPVGDGEYFLEAYSTRTYFQYVFLRVNSRGVTRIDVDDTGPSSDQESSYVLPLGIGRALVWWETTDAYTGYVIFWVAYLHDGELTLLENPDSYTRQSYYAYYAFVIGDGQAIVPRQVRDTLDVDLWYFDNGKFALVPEIKQGYGAGYLTVRRPLGNGRAILRRYADTRTWLFDNGTMTPIDRVGGYFDIHRGNVSEKGFIYSTYDPPEMFYSEGEIDADGKLIKRLVSDTPYGYVIGENKVLAPREKTVIDLKPVVIRH